MQRKSPNLIILWIWELSNMAGILVTLFSVIYKLLHGHQMLPFYKANEWFTSMLHSFKWTLLYKTSRLWKLRIVNQGHTWIYFSICICCVIWQSMQVRRQQPIFSLNYQFVCCEGNIPGYNRHRLFIINSLNFRVNIFSLLHYTIKKNFHPTIHGLVAKYSLETYFTHLIA